MPVNFTQFLHATSTERKRTNDEILALFLPLAKQVNQWHELGLCIPQLGTDAIIADHNRLYFSANEGALPKINKELIRKQNSTAFFKLEARQGVCDKPAPQQLTDVAYLSHYRSWEMQMEHQDALSDIHFLGMILFTLATGLRLDEKADFELFVKHHTNPSILNPLLHSTIKHCIVRMCELERHERPQDLGELIVQLSNYQDFDADQLINLTQLEAYQQTPLNKRHSWLLNKLKTRLFDLSKRNKMFYFKANQGFLDLTAASFPLTFDYDNILQDQLFKWSKAMAPLFAEGKSIKLNKLLSLDEKPFLLPQLDKIRLTAQRDKNEYGFSQLSLVLCFLNWSKIGSKEQEILTSPLLLVPVTLSKQKALKNSYKLTVDSALAEVNPVLKYSLKQQYNIDLPNFIALDYEAIDLFFNNLQTQLNASNAGIRLAIKDKPNLSLLRNDLQQKLINYLNFAGTNLANEHLAQLKTLLKDEVLVEYELTETILSPNTWELDCSRLILGNFNYRKMSLLSDYDTTLQKGLGDSACEQLFSEKPKDLVHEDTSKALDWSDQYSIIASDPAQLKAIQAARLGKSYLIQGPPGTGKSQTISNLIADYVGRGKKVLFVCEKRAALDVVYHRLKSKQLADLCCLIHDSQTDKKQFITQLQHTYQSFLQADNTLNALQTERAQAIIHLRHQLRELEAIQHLMCSVKQEVGMAMHQFFERLHHINFIPLTGNKGHDLQYTHWLQFEAAINKLLALVRQYYGTSYLADSPIAKLNWSNLNMLDTNNLTNLLELIEELNRAFVNADLKENTLDFALLFLGFLNDSSLFFEQELSHLLNAKATATKDFEALVKQYQSQRKAYEQVLLLTETWHNKLSEQELALILPKIQQLETSVFRYFKLSWYRISKALKQRYPFVNQYSRQTYTEVLSALNEEYQLVNSLHHIKKKAWDTYKVNELINTQNAIKTIRKKYPRKLQEAVLAWAEKQETQYKTLLRKSKEMQYALEETKLFLQTPNDHDLTSLEKISRELLVAQYALQELQEPLNKLSKAPKALISLLQQQQIDTSDLEQQLANNTLEKLIQAHPFLSATGVTYLNEVLQQLPLLLKELHHLNAKLLLSQCKVNFQEKVNKAQQANSVLTKAEQAWKKDYQVGRKILEREFEKKRAFKSIRELAEGNASEALRDLKPVWLMSPLSVSDALPLDESFFDVVIFDEASQIPLEEGFPPMLRAKQYIIVGDEMQMPPSNFFTSQTQEVDQLPDDLLEESIATDADSLLAQGSRSLPSHLLSWHYRSNNEQLIAFSNSAFYQNQLFTVPSKALPNNKDKALTVNTIADSKPHLDELLSRSISYHHLPQGIYENRCNQAEAQYIAALLREIVLHKKDKTIGVVAFSQEQQLAIEKAIEDLQQNDALFEASLEQEQNRTEDGHFSGLFVKNLEHVQGDERDIIVISTCYGYNRHGKMHMNFGPINRSGGEKRLNVIFSRAKAHVVVVSSIKYSDIKNLHNDGANYFSKYLHYAELISLGSTHAANNVLKTMRVNNLSDKNEQKSKVITQLQLFLEQEGFSCETNIGQSEFKCHLAVLHPNKNEYVLGIMVDEYTQNGSSEVLASYLQRNTMLQNSGWEMMWLLSKDWLLKKEQVKAKLMLSLRGLKV